MSDRDRAFTEYFAARSTSMRNTAYLLCGDWHRAEDLVQTAFTKLYLAWNRVTRPDALDPYTRQTLMRAFLDERRRGWFRREQVSESPPEAPWPPPPRSEDRMVLEDALAAVPPRQRAVLVLRYFEDLSVEATAAALGCSAGTVKSQASRGLDALRAALPAANTGNWESGVR